jgi:hypothetical protein
VLVLGVIFSSKVAIVEIDNVSIFGKLRKNYSVDV